MRNLTPEKKATIFVVAFVGLFLLFLGLGAALGSVGSGAALFFITFIAALFLAVIWVMARSFFED